MKRIIYAAYIPAVIWMYIIAGFSGTRGEESSGLSLRVTERIVDVLDVITYGDSYTEEERAGMVERLHTPVRKAAHMTEYAVLYVLVVIPMFLTVKGVRKRNVMVLALLVCIVYASFDEIHQLYVEGRDGRYTDVLIDTAGSLLGAAVISCVNKLANRKIECERKK